MELTTREAFGDIVRQYQSLVLSVAYSITGNRQESEDLAQETFIAAWQHQQKLREVEKLPAWLCGIARNLANNYLRKTQLERQSRTESALEEIPATTAVQDDSESEERIALLWATLKEIPLQFREVLVMYYQENQSVATIASALEISEDNVRQRIARGRTYLKKEVERQVEKTLAHIRPGEHFTVAVLAALPILASGEQVLAAGSAGAAAAQSASSGGAGAGATFIAGIATFCCTLFGAILSTVFIGLGIVLGIWSGIRNAPTLRSRQWMTKVALGYVIFGSLFFMFFVLSLDVMQHNTSHEVVYNDDGGIVDIVQVKTPLAIFCMGIWYSLGVILPAFVLVSSLFANRKWRKIVEEDSTKAGMERSAMTDLQSVYMWGRIALHTFLFALVAVVVSAVCRGIPLKNVFDSFFCIFPIILLFGVSLYYFAIRISKYQACIEKYPPRLPNLLSILTGEEKAPKGVRNRINFWGDLVGIGWGLFVMHVMTLLPLYLNVPNIHYVHESESGHTLCLIWLSLILLMYFLFAVFFAGIPRRRYWGMIFLGVSVLLIDNGVLLIHLMFSDEKIGILGFAYAVSFWYLLCFTLLGVGGLWVFRRKESEVRS
jgi:RNA polymerase sigma factor (sigma-70 family)